MITISSRSDRVGARPSLRVVTAPWRRRRKNARPKHPPGKAIDRGSLLNDPFFSLPAPTSTTVSHGAAHRHAIALHTCKHIYIQCKVLIFSTPQPARPPPATPHSCKPFTLMIATQHPPAALPGQVDFTLRAPACRPGRATEEAVQERTPPDWRVW